jgi:hypothetical protein
MAQKRKKTETLPVRMAWDERPIIKKAAKIVGRSESRFLVMAGLLLSDFETEEQLRTALQNGRELVQARMMAVMQVRRVGNQLKEIRSEWEAENSSVRAEKMDGVLDELIETMKFLRASWRGRSQK